MELIKIGGQYYQMLEVVSMGKKSATVRIKIGPNKYTEAGVSFKQLATTVRGPSYGL